MKTIFLYLIALTGFQHVLAQEEFIEPSRLLTKFRFTTLTGGVILLKGQVAPFPDTLNFIIDTGSGGI